MNIVMIAHTKHLVPIFVYENTSKKYSALYEDKDGKYEFTIHKTKSGYEVESDGFLIPMEYKKEGLIWEFESQLSVIQKEINCLK
jgi:hypothetical protein